MFSFMVAVAAGFIFLITKKIDEVSAATKLQKFFLPFYKNWLR